MPIDPAASALFIFAHADDEFFCLPVIRRAIGQGRKTICAYLTDGAYGGQSAELRMRESTAVLVRLGVSREDIHFIGVDEGIPDGKLYQHPHRAHTELVRLMQGRVLDGIYTPAWEGGHQDHDACYALAVALAKTCQAQLPWQFALYNGFRAPFLFNVMQALSQNGEPKPIRIGWGEAVRNLLTVASYPSQWRTWLALFPFAAWRILASRCCVLQLASQFRLTERPHEGVLLYEKRGHAHFGEVHAALTAFMEAIGVT